MDYEKLFQRTLIKEEGEPINMSPPPGPTHGDATPSDGDAWNDSNSAIVNDDELSSSFDTEGLDNDEIEKYSSVISSWDQGLAEAIKQLGQMIKFASGERLADAPGSEQFSELIKLAPSLKRDLSGFKSQVEDLSETVKLAINDARKERTSRK